MKKVKTLDQNQYKPPYIIMVKNNWIYDEEVLLFNNESKYMNVNSSNISIHSLISGVSYEKILTEIEHKKINISKILVIFSENFFRSIQKRKKDEEFLYITKNKKGINVPLIFIKKDGAWNRADHCELLKIYFKQEQKDRACLYYKKQFTYQDYLKIKIPSESWIKIYLFEECDSHIL